MRYEKMAWVKIRYKRLIEKVAIGYGGKRLVHDLTRDKLHRAQVRQKALVDMVRQSRKQPVFSGILWLLRYAHQMSPAEPAAAPTRRGVLNVEIRHSCSSQDPVLA